MRLIKSAVMVIVILTIQISIAFADDSIDFLAKSLIIEDTNTYELMCKIDDECKANRHDWLSVYLYYVSEAALYRTTYDNLEIVKDIVESFPYSDVINDYKCDEESSAERLFFAGQIVAEFYNDTVNAQKQLWRAYEVSSDPQLKMRILDEISSYTVYGSEYSYIDTVLSSGDLHCRFNAHLSAIDESSFEACQKLAAEYQNVLKNYGFFRHCRISPAGSGKRLNYCELMFLLEYYCINNQLSNLAESYCKSMGRDFVKLEMPDNDKNVYRLYMYGLQAVILSGRDKERSYLTYKNNISILVKNGLLDYCMDNYSLIQNMLTVSEN